MARLFLSLGKTHGVQAKDIVGMLYREAELPDGSLGRIALFPKHSLVEVPQEWAEKVIRKASGAKLRGRIFRMDFDRGPA